MCSSDLVPDEATKFPVPPGSTVWHHDLEGHYEAVRTQNDVSQIKEGEWAAPPMTFKLPGGAGYASITEAALVNYSGMALQADGRRGFNIVLGHKHRRADQRPGGRLASTGCRTLVLETFAPASNRGVTRRVLQET